MLKLENISLSFGEKTVLQNCSLSLAPGERLALMGPSGCGKTTLLRVALGLQVPDAGTVQCRAQKTAAVFQEPRLLPWSTAQENVGIVLMDSADARAESLRWLEKMELKEAAALYPTELSGGMQQRVSLARALAVRPDLLVMDEPFKAMDEALTGRVLQLTADSLGSTALLLATHSEAEAEALGCRILRWQDGTFLPVP